MLPIGKTKDCRDVFGLQIEGVDPGDPLQTLCQVLTRDKDVDIKSFGDKMMGYSAKASKARSRKKIKAAEKATAAQAAEKARIVAETAERARVAAEALAAGEKLLP